MNKRTAISILFFLILVFAFFIRGDLNRQESLDTPDNQSSYKKITAEEAKENLDTNKNIIVLDVRTEAEYAEGHIEDSILIPIDNIKSEVEKRIPAKEKIIYVYCRSGNRSSQAARTLIDLGYINVYDLGGINDWPYKIVR